MYFDIVLTGDFTILQKTGIKNRRICLEKWEEIVERNNEQHNNFDYINCLALQKSQALYYNEYVMVKAALSILCYVEDPAIVEELQSMGYHFSFDTVEAYINSLNTIKAQSDNLETKIMMCQKELDKYYKPIKNKKKDAWTFDKVMVNLIERWGKDIPDSITLIRYNEYIVAINDRKAKKDGTR